MNDFYAGFIAALFAIAVYNITHTLLTWAVRKLSETK